jgi:hypothetical protein
MDDFLHVPTISNGTFYITRHLIRLCQEIHVEAGGSKSYQFAEELQEPFYLSQLLQIAIDAPNTIVSDAQVGFPAIHLRSEWSNTIVSIRSNDEQQRDSNVLTMIITKTHREIIAIGCETWLIRVDANRTANDMHFQPGTKFNNVDPGFHSH